MTFARIAEGGIFSKKKRLNAVRFIFYLLEATQRSGALTNEVFSIFQLDSENSVWLTPVTQKEQNLGRNFKQK